MKGAITAWLSLAVLIGGCTVTREPVAPLATKACPDHLQRQISVSGSSVPITAPAEIARAYPSAQTIVGRRIILSATVDNGVRGLHVFSSSVSITTVGGIFAGWAALEPAARPGRALEIIPGRIRIRSFLTAPRSQTIALDVLLIPGGVAVDEMTVNVKALWNEDQGPVDPQQLEPTLNPVRHFTTFDSVSATLTLDLVLGKSRASQHPWSCSFESAVPLVSRDETLPPLWGITRTTRGAQPKSWIALYERSKGPIRVLFDDPASARGFARWLEETTATRAGEYGLGLLTYDDAEARRRDPLATGKYRGLTPEDTGALGISRLGER